MVGKGSASSFTSLRIWGSIGFLVPALLFFPFVHGKNPNFELTVWYGAILSFISAAVTYRVIPSGTEVSKQQSELPSVGAVKAILKPELRGFTICRFLTQIGIWIWYPFFPLYLKENGVDSSWIGPIINVGVLAEIVFAFYVSKVQISSGGRFIALIAALSVSARLILVSAFANNLLIVVLLQILHGPYIWAMFFRGTVYLTEHVEDRFRTSFLALNGIIFHGITRAIAGPIGGTVAMVANSRGLDGLASALFVGGVISGLGVIVSLFYIPASETTILKTTRAN